MSTVLVVDDSSVMRTIVERALSGAGYDVITAADGREAIEAVERHEPAIVTMDVVMPELDGIEAVERIMERRPTPVVMLSAYTTEGAEATLEALERGAVDFIPKPTTADEGRRNLAHLSDDVVETVDELLAVGVSPRALARAGGATPTVPVSTGGGAGEPDSPVTTVPQARESPRTRSLGGNRESIPSVTDTGPPTIVIGASTGGPKLVESILESLPRSLDASVLIVQHMPPPFTERFATRLDAICAYDVQEASAGATVGPGEAVVARGDSHLEVAAGSTPGALTVTLDAESDRVHGVRPAIDVTMRSVATTLDGPVCGIVLSGMGADGAAGVEAIHAAGGMTIAQDEASSPVFGMPKKAAETGCVDWIGPPEAISAVLDDGFSSRGGRDA